jgi:hypothetical protein
MNDPRMPQGCLLLLVMFVVAAMFYLTECR